MLNEYTYEHKKSIYNPYEENLKKITERKFHKFNVVNKYKLSAC